MSGEVAVQASETDGFQQIVNVLPREIYELEVQARAEVPDRPFRLRVHWLNGDGNVCDGFLRIVAATTSWRRYTARLTAPDCAIYAEIFVNGQGADWVWLDNFAFIDTDSRSPAPKY